MYSKHHAAISLVVGGVAADALSPIVFAGTAVPVPALLAYALVVGVGIDLDHFLIARYRTGTWEAARFCLRNPAAAIADQSRIFDRGDVGRVPRLLSHLAIGAASVALLAPASIGLAAFTAVPLAAHVASDVAWDVVQVRAHGDPGGFEGDD